MVVLELTLRDCQPALEPKAVRRDEYGTKRARYRITWHTTCVTVPTATGSDRHGCQVIGLSSCSSSGYGPTAHEAAPAEWHQ